MISATNSLCKSPRFHLFRYGTNVADGSRVTNMWINSNTFSTFFDAKMNGTIIYILSEISGSGTKMISFNVDNNSDVKAFNFDIPQTTFLENGNDI